MTAICSVREFKTETKKSADLDVRMEAALVCRRNGPWKRDSAFSEIFLRFQTANLTSPVRSRPHLGCVGPARYDDVGRCRTQSTGPLLRATPLVFRRRAGSGLRISRCALATTAACSENPATLPTWSKNSSLQSGRVCSVNILRSACGPTAPWSSRVAALTVPRGRQLFAACDRSWHITAGQICTARGGTQTCNRPPTPDMHSLIIHIETLEY